MSNTNEQQTYRRKIKTPQELLEVIGPRPRTKKIIMCHGVFDLVHPGHVQHLMYAKSKADLLVASLTSDAHVSKANFRPFVPQDLRAMNLAALEVIDYVIIDENPAPVENIKLLQPDFFAKGYEYYHGGVHPKTREEIATLESYGGEVIFTPGDIVYSSSAFIEVGPPQIAPEKLITLMKSEGLTFQDLRDALHKFKGTRIHVVGDTIVDSYTYCTLIGGTAKTPTFSVKYEKQVDYVGGAAIVAKHMQKAGASVRFSTVLGDDLLGKFVTEDLQKNEVDCRAIVDSTRPTTQKNAFIAGGYRMLKVDRVDNRQISGRILEQIKFSISESPAEAVVLSDFRHGMFGKKTIPEIAASIPAGALKVADSQVANRWGNILDFEGFDLITPNEREARFALGDQDSVIRPLALELYRRAKCRTLILKAGERGILTYREPNDDVRSFFTVDSFAQDVVDAVGAGDALLAYATLSMVSTGSCVVASILGSIAAAIACEHDGNTPIAPDLLLEKLAAIERRTNHL